MYEQVACRQFGYKRATLVTNCKALYKLSANFQLEKIPDGDTAWWKNTTTAKRDRLYHVLCGEEQLDKLCPSSFVVDGKQTDYSRLERLAWLRYNAEARVLGANGSADVLRSDLLVEELFGIYQLDSPMPPSSSCSGVEDDISACFQAQMQELIRRAGNPETQRPVSKHKCTSKLLIGCSDDMAGAPGTWVVGDQVEKSHPSLTHTLKVFQQYGGPYSCATGKELATTGLRGG